MIDVIRKCYYNPRMEFETPTSLPSDPRLVDIIYSVKKVGQLREALPVSITDRLGEGKLGVDLTIRMLRNLSCFPVQKGEGEWLTNKCFEDFVSVNTKSWETSEELAQKMAEIALEEGIIERHEEPGIPRVKYIIQTPVQKQLGKIFKPRGYWR